MKITPETNKVCLERRHCFYSAQGARWEISTNEAHLLGLIIGYLYTKVAKSSSCSTYLMHIHYVCTNRVICACTGIVLSQQSHLRLCRGPRRSLVVVWEGRPLPILSFHDHALSEDTRILVFLANSLFHSLTADVCLWLSKSVTTRCSLSGTLAAIEILFQELVAILEL